MNAEFILGALYFIKIIENIIKRLKPSLVGLKSSRSLLKSNPLWVTSLDIDSCGLRFNTAFKL